MDCFEREIYRQERAKEKQRERYARYRAKKDLLDLARQRVLLEDLWGDAGDTDLPALPPKKAAPSKKVDSRKAFQLKYPLKAKAHKLVQRALLSRRLKKKRCEICGKRNDVHAHHDDYSKPLDVRWLCRPHHQEWHRHNKPKYDPAWEKKTTQKVRKNV